MARATCKGVPTSRNVFCSDRLTAEHTACSYHQEYSSQHDWQCKSPPWRGQRKSDPIKTAEVRPALSQDPPAYSRVVQQTPTSDQRLFPAYLSHQSRTEQGGGTRAGRAAGRVHLPLTARQG